MAQEHKKMNDVFSLIPNSLDERLSIDLNIERNDSPLLFSGPHSSGKLYKAIEISRKLTCDIAGNFIFFPYRNMLLYLKSAKNVFEQYPSEPTLFSLRNSLISYYSSVCLDNDEGISNSHLYHQILNLDLSKNDINSSVEEIYSEISSYKFTQGLVMSDVDKISEFSSKFTVNNSYRIVIIEAVELLNQSVSNAMLKTLEEGFDKTLFILLSTAPQQIMKTILSRVKRYNFPPVSNEIKQKYFSIFSNKKNNETSDINFYLKKMADKKIEKIAVLANDYLRYILDKKKDTDIINRINDIFQKDFIEDMSQKEKFELFLKQLSHSLEKLFTAHPHFYLKTTQLMKKINKANLMVNTYNENPVQAIELISM